MAPLNLSLLLLRVDYIVCDIGTVKNRILARHFLNGEKKGGITVKGSHIAKRVKSSRYTTVFKTPAKGKRMLAVLLCVCLVAGCAAFSGCGEEPSPYNWEVAIVDSFDPEQWCLKELPWLTPLEEVKEILGVENLPEGDFEQWENEDGSGVGIAVYNLKIKEYRYPVEIHLYFKNDLPEANQEGMLLCGYIFGISEIDGYAVYPDEGENHSAFEQLPEEQREAYYEICDEDRRACLQSLSDKYGAAIAEKNYGNNPFESMKENSAGYQSFNYQFPGQQQPTSITMLFSELSTIFRFYQVRPFSPAASNAVSN